MIKCVWKCASATCAKQEHAKDWQKCFEGVRITYTMCSSESECARVQHVQNRSMLKTGKSASEVQKYHIRIPIRTRDVRVLPESPKYPECPMFILRAPPKSQVRPPAVCLYVEPDVLAGCLPEAPVARVTHWIRTTEPYAEEPNYVCNICVCNL